MPEKGGLPIEFALLLVDGEVVARHVLGDYLRQ